MPLLHLPEATSPIEITTAEGSDNDQSKSSESIKEDGSNNVVQCGSVQMFNLGECFKKF